MVIKKVKCAHDLPEIRIRFLRHIKNQSSERAAMTIRTNESETVLEIVKAVNWVEGTPELAWAVETIWPEVTAGLEAWGVPNS